MNFAAAAKTRFPIRRPGWKHWIVFNETSQMYEWEHGESIAPDMRPEWFDAEDWEVDWPDVVITTGKYWSSVSEAMKDTSVLFMTRPGEFDLQRFLQVLAQKLGVG
jgi:hypothetical protein